MKVFIKDMQEEFQLKNPPHIDWMAEHPGEMILDLLDGSRIITRSDRDYILIYESEHEQRTQEQRLEKYDNWGKRVRYALSRHQYEFGRDISFWEYKQSIKPYNWEE